MRPDVYLDFARAGRAAIRRARVLRASSGWRRGPTGIWREEPAGAARFHHAQNGDPLGILMEWSRVNHWTGSRMEPAGSTGLPTGYVASGTDAAITTYLAQEIRQGLPGRRVQIVGTSSAAISRHLSTGSLTLTPGDYVYSRFAAFLSGWDSQSPRLQSFGTSVIGPNLAPLVALTRYSLAVSIAGGSASFAVSTNPNIPTGTSLNLDAFYAADMVEGGLYAGTPILHPAGSPGAVTRAAESLIALLADFGAVAGTEGTLLVAGRAAPGLELAGAAQRAIQVDLGSNDNAVRVDRISGRQIRSSLVVGGNTIASATSSGTVADNADFVAVIPYDATSLALTLNGAAPVEAATGQGITPTRIFLGDWGGTIERIAWWSRKLPNAQAQSIARQGVLA